MEASSQARNHLWLLYSLIESIGRRLDPVESGLIELYGLIRGVEKKQAEREQEIGQRIKSAADRAQAAMEAARRAESRPEPEIPDPVDAEARALAEKALKAAREAAAREVPIPEAKPGLDGKSIEKAELVEKDGKQHLILVRDDGKRLDAGALKLPEADESGYAFNRGQTILRMRNAFSREEIEDIVEEIVSGEQINDQPVPFSFTASGDNTIYTPSAGKAIRLHRIRALNDPDAADAVELRLKRGTIELQRGYIIEYRPSKALRDGAVGEALVLNLGASGSVSGTAYIEEFTPA